MCEETDLGRGYISFFSGDVEVSRVFNRSLASKRRPVRHADGVGGLASVPADAQVGKPFKDTWQYQPAEV